MNISQLQWSWTDRQTDLTFQCNYKRGCVSSELPYGQNVVMYLTGNYIHHQLNIKSLHFVHTVCFNTTLKTGRNYNPKQHYLAGFIMGMQCLLWGRNWTVWSVFHSNIFPLNKAAKDTLHVLPYTKQHAMHCLQRLHYAKWLTLFQKPSSAHGLSSLISWRKEHSLSDATSLQLKIGSQDVYTKTFPVSLVHIRSTYHVRLGTGLPTITHNLCPPWD